MAVWQWERGSVCVWERVLGYIQVFLMCLAVLLLRCTRMLWLGMPCYTLKKEKKKRTSCKLSSVFVQVLVNFREGGGEENLSLATVSSTASTETHNLRSPKLHHFLLVNLIRLLMFQKECQFFCISAKAVQQCAHIWLLWPLHVAKMTTVTLRTEYSNSVFAVCHIQMNICITVCGGGVVCRGGVAPGKLARQMEAIQ